MTQIGQAFYDLIYNNVLFKQILPALHLPRIPVLQSAVSPKLVHSITPFVSLIILAFIAAGILFLIKLLYQIRKSLSETSTLLEITPPVFTEKSAYTTSQLFSVIHNLGSKNTLKDKLLGNKITFSFEIVSTLDQGIRYLTRTSSDQKSNLKRNVTSYLPQVSVKEVADYLPRQENLKKGHTKIFEFKLTKHFAFPLQKQNILDEHDPVAYITGMMTKLSPGEIISFQIVLAPKQVREVNKISRMVLRNEDVLGYLNKPFIPVVLKPMLFVFGLAIKLIAKSGEELQWVISEVTHPSSPAALLATQQAQALKKMQRSLVKPARVISSFEQQHIQSVQEKINQSLFETSIRVLAVMNDEKSLQNRAVGFQSSLAVYSVPQYQSFVLKSDLPFGFLNKINWLTFKNRLLSPVFNSGSSLLSVSEVADLYHFPYTSTTKTENISKLHSKELPAPLSLKQKEALDVYFAKNTYGGSDTMIGLTEDERRRHIYIIGATGTGKSTMLLSMVKQDIENGKGVCVIDPHGDLVEKILPLIPEKRIKDVIYFNPDDIGYPIGLNLLELTSQGTDDEKVREKEFITESIISLFHKIYSDKYSGPRMEYILRNTIHTAFVLPNPTLFTVYKLLMNTTYRKGVVAQLTDENLKDFWKYEFNKAGDFQKVNMIGPITNKIGRFLFSAPIKRILEQEKSSINFDEIMDTGKIILCNLSKGRLGEDNSEVLGIMVMTKIQLAALKRAQKPMEDRKDFYLYVDEFQNFATPSFAEILSEARKYKLNAILTHQTTSQLEDPSLVNITLANTGTVICFRTANPEDERLILPQFKPYVDPGEISNLPSFHFYMKIAAINPEEPFSGETIPINISPNPAKVKKIVESSHNLYARKYIGKNEMTTKIEKKQNTQTPNSILP